MSPSVLGSGHSRTVALLLLAIALFPYITDLVNHAQTGQQEAEAAIAELNLPDWLTTTLQDVVASADTIAGDAATRVADLVGILVLATFLLFFFLRDGDKAWGWLFQWIDEEKRERIDSAGDEALRRVGNFVRATTALASIADLFLVHDRLSVVLSTI